MNRQKTTTLGLALVFVLGFAASEACGAEPGWEAVDKVFGATGKSLAGGVYRFGWPRSDLHVSVGSVVVEPTLALGSWGAFLRMGAGGEVMTMGDLVLLDSEVTPVVTALGAGGLEVTAIHNHLLNEIPHVAYVHFSGHGERDGGSSDHGDGELHRAPLAHAGRVAPPLLHALLGCRCPGEDRRGPEGSSRTDPYQVSRKRRR